MDSKRVGLWLALAALLVNGPRFVLIFLKIDSIDMPKPMEAALLTATGIATGLVLTGGGAYIAHALAKSRTGGMLRWFMILCWFLLLIFSVVLLAPLMVAAIDESPLKTVLNSKFSQWLWSITSVLAVEVIAGGAMVAYALHGRINDNSENSIDTPDIISVLTGALVQRIANSVAPASAPVPTPMAVSVSQANKASTVIPTLPNEDIPQIPEIEQVLADTEEVSEQSLPDEESRKYTKKERQQMLQKELQNMGKEADIQVDVLATKLNVSPQTIYRDLIDLRKSTNMDSVH